MRIALDVLPCQASSVPCERLFSASKQTAENCRASLGAKRFEELQVMKFAGATTLLVLLLGIWGRLKRLMLMSIVKCWMQMSWQLSLTS